MQYLLHYIYVFFFNEEIWTLIGLQLDQKLILNICLANSATSHTILKDRKYFSQIKMGEAYVTIISGSIRLIKGFGILEGTRFIINNALFFSKSQKFTRFQRYLL